MDQLEIVDLYVFNRPLLSLCLYAAYINIRYLPRKPQKRQQPRRRLGNEISTSDVLSVRAGRM